MPKRHGFSCQRAELRKPRAGRARSRAPRRRERLRLRRVRGLRPVGHGAQGQARHGRAQPRPLARRHRVLRRAPQGAARPRQHLGLLARGARADGRCRAGDRAPHRRGRLRRAARRRAARARDARPRPLPSLGHFHRGRGRAGEALRGGGVRGVEEDPQFRGRDGLGAADAVRVRQQPGLQRRLPRLAPLPVVRGDRRGQGPDAARRLVQRGARARGARRAARARPLRRPARRGAPGRAQDRHLPGAGAVRGAGGDRADRPFRLGGERRQPLPQDLVPARQPGQAGVRAAGAHRGAAAPAARHGLERVRRGGRGDARARDRARRAWWRATSSAATRRASSA